MRSLDELIAPITEDAANEKLLDILTSLGLPARSWRKGGAYRSIVRAFARTYADVTTLTTAVIRGNFLDLAEGDWLTQLAHFVYGVDRQDATFATGEATFTSTGAIYTQAEGTVRIKNPTSGKVYENAEALVIGVGQVVTIAIRAIEQGSDSSTGPATITAFETFLLGLAVTNAAAVVGQDPESDPDLRAHCKNKLAALSIRGPRGAYAYAVTQAKRDDGSPVNVNRYAISPSSSTGVVTLYVASPAGPVSDDDLDIIRASVELYARPDSVTAIVLGATPVPFTKTITIWASRTDGVDASIITTGANNALTTLIKNWRIGGRTKPPSTQGYLYADAVSSAVKNSNDSVYDVDWDELDMALSPGQVATFAATFDVRIVDE